MLHREIPTFDNYVSRLILRSPLAENERQAIRDLPMAIRTVKPGRNLVRAGDPVDGVWLVLDGLIGSSKLNRRGARQIVALHIQGDIADQPSAMLTTASCGLEALTQSTVAHVSQADLKEISGNFPAVAMAFWRDCATDATVQAQWTANTGRKDARSRLAHLICEMASRYEQAGWQVGLSFELPMTQQDLADATAMTPVHLNRTLMSLRREGIIDMRNKLVQILDWKALTELAEFDPAYLQYGPAAVQ